MGVLDNNQNGSGGDDTKASASATKTPTPTDISQQKTGYERPLFEDTKPKWNDDRMSTESVETRYHDKEMVLKVANGLCYDIFFRADDVYRPDFDEIPDFAAPVLEEEAKSSTEKVDGSTKPLDSKTKQRTYILNPDEVEEEKKPRKSSSRGSRRRRPRNSSRRRGPSNRSKK